MQTGDDASAVTSDATETTKPEVTKAAATKPIKNQSGVSSMIKMIAITLVVFIATVAVGVGISFGLLTLSKSKTPATPTPTAVEEVTPRQHQNQPKLHLSQLNLILLISASSLSTLLQKPAMQEQPNPNSKPLVTAP